MKKVKYLVIFLISIFAFNINVFAASGSLSVSSEGVYVGDNFTVSVYLSSVAAWNIHVSASGPVSGCSINQADGTGDAMDANKSFSATCTATGTGNIVLTLSGDITSASDGNAVNVSGSRNVTVSPRIILPPSNNDNNSNNDDTRSKNNNLKDLSVDGYDLVKVDENNYTLSVPNDVTSLNIKATAEDSKSNVLGTGNHNIVVGENNIAVVVTAENGSQNVINIKVTRRDGYYLEDLDSALKSSKNDDLNIIIKSDTKINSSELGKIKASGKRVKFNYYNDDKNLVYSWIVDGSKLKNADDLIMTIANDSESKKDVLRLSNYADGLTVAMAQTNHLSTGIQLKLFVGDKYNDSDVVNVYAYAKKNDKLELVQDKVKVENGYILFDIKDASDYFVTMSNIHGSDKVITTKEKSFSPISLTIIGIQFVLVIVLVIAFVFKTKKSMKSSDSSNDNQNNTPPTNDHEMSITDSNTVDTINSTQNLNQEYSVYNMNNQINTTPNNINQNNPFH